MTDDDFLRELAQANRETEAEERHRLDERWDRLSRGQLSPEEEAELRALAETSEEDREAYEAFRPLGPDFHASVVQAVREQAEAEIKAAEPKAKLLPFPRPLAGWSAAAAAVAAALVLLLRLPQPIPEYGLPEVSGGIRTMRGESKEMEVPVFVPGAPVEVVLRPLTATSGAKQLEARCFLCRDQEVRLLELRSTIVSGGSVKMEGTIPRDVPPGTWTLWAVVGRPGKLPEPADLRALSAERQVRQRAWVASPREILIQAREDLPP